MTDYINFKSLKRSPKPNNCLVAPEDFCLASEADLQAPAFAMTGRGLFSKLQEIISSEKRWGTLSADPEQLRLSFIATSGLLRFKDDIDLEVIPLSDTEATLAIYSRSRVGYSDLGVNTKRVKELIRRVTAN